MNGHAGLEYAISQYSELFSHIKQDTRQQRQEERVAEAKRLVSKHGKLPNSSWLIANGYRRLYYSLQRHPDAFAKIPRQHKRRHPRGARRNGRSLQRNTGKVPSPGWLRKNGHGLHHALREHPNAFTHLEQDSKRGRTSREWAMVAESLVKKYGKLPGQRWLRGNGYCGLQNAVTKYPKLFAHLKT